MNTYVTCCILPRQLGARHLLRTNTCERETEVEMGRGRSRTMTESLTKPWPANLGGNPGVSVFVYLGCYNKLPQTRGLQQQCLFLTVLEASSLRSGCQNDQVLVKTIFWVICCWLLIESLPRRKRTNRYLVSFTKALIPLEGPTFMTIYLPQAHFQILSHWDFQYMNFNTWICVCGRGDTNIQSIAVSIAHQSVLWWAELAGPLSLLPPSVTVCAQSWEGCNPGGFFEAEADTKGAWSRPGRLMFVSAQTTPCVTWIYSCTYDQVPLLQSSGGPMFLRGNLEEGD